MPLISELSHYVDLLLKSKFPQFQLLNPKAFSDELKKRDIRINERSLEYYDKKGIIRPCLRINRPIVNQPGQKYASMSLGSPYGWTQLYREGFVELVKDGDFEPWENYDDNDGGKTWLYYHPWQLLFVKTLTQGAILKYHRSFFESEDLDPKKFVEEEKKSYNRYIDTMKKRNEGKFIPIIGLLMLLEEPYKVNITHRFYPNEDHEDSFKNWNGWKKNTFSPQDLLDKTGFEISALEKLYEELVFDADRLDPLNMWHTFMMLIRRGKKRKLKGDALLAQDFFDALEYLSLIIYDITGKQMPAPDETGPWNNGWKEILYGKPYDPKTQKTQNRILSDFLDNRPIIASIIYEGDTEDKVIRKILDSIYLFNPEDGGLHLYNTNGSGNMTQPNLDGYITRANYEENDIYLIIDKDAEGLLKKHLDNGTIKSENCTVWNGDFELDNFGIQMTVDKINQLLTQKNARNIVATDVERIMNEQNRKLIDAIRWVVYKETGLNLERDVITKPNLALSIMETRFQEIQKEYEEKEWKPLFPIEKVLKPILRTMPQYIN